MRVELSTEPGSPSRANEDFAAVALPASDRAGALVVLDGVTPPPYPTGCTHPVPWYAARLGGALLELSASLPSLALTECLAQAIGRTADAHRGTCDLSHPRIPQATVVAARWSAESVEYLVLSDSVLLLDRGSSTQAVLDSRLDRLPEPVPALRAQVRTLPLGSAERAAAAAEYAAAVEALRNTGDGFFTAAADPAVAERAVTGQVPRAGVRALVALTDGASRITDVFHETDWAGVVDLLRKQGPRELIARVRAAERTDPARTTFPRGKPHDDATAVLVEL